jgi:hypothetical protein
MRVVAHISPGLRATIQMLPASDSASGAVPSAEQHSSSLLFPNEPVLIDPFWTVHAVTPMIDELDILVPHR